MTVITVLRPDKPEATTTPASLAPRARVEDGGRLLIVDNGKSMARELLQFIADELCRELPITEVEVVSKPSAGAPIDADLARMLAVRSRLVLTGLGD